MTWDWLGWEATALYSFTFQHHFNIFQPYFEEHDIPTSHYFLTTYPKLATAKSSTWSIFLGVSNRWQPMIWLASLTGEPWGAEISCYSMYLHVLYKPTITNSSPGELCPFILFKVQRLYNTHSPQSKLLDWDQNLWASPEWLFLGVPIVIDMTTYYFFGLKRLNLLMKMNQPGCL